MSVTTDATVRSEEKVKVTRSRRNVAWTGLGALVVVVVLALFPYIVYSGTTAIMVQGLIVLTIASMWNLLAGYAGLVSVGQQAFFGLGASFVLIPAMHGLSPFLSLPIATVGAGVAAFPLWWLVSRLRLGYFAIATWVLAEAVALFIDRARSVKPDFITFSGGVAEYLYKREKRQFGEGHEAKRKDGKQQRCRPPIRM